MRGSGSLQFYFRDLHSAPPILTRAQEKELASQLRIAEREAWFRALNKPPAGFQEAVLSALRRDVKRVLTDGKSRSKMRLAEKIQQLDNDRIMIAALRKLLPRKHLATTSVQHADKLFSDFAGANLRLVIAHAHRWAARTGVEVEELLQAGNEGLLTAIHRFDPDRGFRLSTYATWWIRHHIHRYAQNAGKLVRVPVWRQDAQQQIRVAMARANSHGEELTRVELAKRIGMTLRRVEQVGAPVSFVSLDAPISAEGDGPALVEFMEAPSTPAEQVISISRAAGRIVRALSILADRDVRILQQRFGFLGGEERTLEEVGTNLKPPLTRERVRQLEVAALAKLRAALVAEELEEKG